MTVLSGVATHAALGLGMVGRVRVHGVTNHPAGGFLPSQTESGFDSAGD